MADLKVLALRRRLAAAEASGDEKLAESIRARLAPAVTEPEPIAPPKRRGRPPKKTTAPEVEEPPGSAETATETDAPDWT